MGIILSSAPVRYRPMMISVFLVKDNGTLALSWQYLTGFISNQWLVIGIIDGIFAVLFSIAFWITRRESRKQML